MWYDYLDWIMENDRKIMNDRKKQKEKEMNAFELNSVHLNAAGYKFGMAMMQGEVIGGIMSTPDIDVDCYEQTVMVPLWVNPDKTTKDELVAILGSEPKVGEQEEVTLPQHEVKNLVYTEPKKMTERKNNEQYF